jgi:hypothetical protein
MHASSSAEGEHGMEITLPSLPMAALQDRVTLEDGTKVLQLFPKQVVSSTTICSVVVVFVPAVHPPGMGQPTHSPTTSKAPVLVFVTLIVAHASSAIGEHGMELTVPSKPTPRQWTVALKHSPDSPQPSRHVDNVNRSDVRASSFAPVLSFMPSSGERR